MIVESVRRIGCAAIEKLEDIGRSGTFLSRTLIRVPHPLKSLPYIIEQVYHIGVLTLLLIMVSSLFVGMVMGLQGYNTLIKFGASQELGQLVALSVVRELGPVVTALLFAGRAGSALTAEIGLMKTTEQLKAMEMMAVDPLWRIIAPRFWGGFIAMPILSAIFCVVAVYGGYMVGVQWLGVDGGSYWSNMQAAVDFKIDILSGVIKSIAFGFVVTWIAIFQGYDSVPTAAGISQSTTRTVVYSSLAVLGLDFVLTAMMIGGW